MDRTVLKVTEDIRTRSRETRRSYLDLVDRAARTGPSRTALSCSNLAHATAACPASEKAALARGTPPNLAIVSAYNDILSAHQPFERFPDVIRKAARDAGGVAQFAGGVPAMCDGVTQGRPGMELSLFSRDVIAMATAVALSHDMFDAALCLGVCDKIVPGLLIGALSFGHLPVVLVPAGPMPPGLPNREKSAVRQRHAEGKAGDDELLDAEMRSYHAPGTCTFYGTANSNQMLMELMGLHVPGAAFVGPGTALRDRLTAAAARRALEITALGGDHRPIGRIVDERAVVNGVVGLLATGGSTNHALHLVAIAKAAGLRLALEDIDALSGAVPLIARVYPNGEADINRFRDAGGTGFVVARLLDAGLLHEDAATVWKGGLRAYAADPRLEGGGLAWTPAPRRSRDEQVLRPPDRPFAPTGGLKVVSGNLGRGVSKISAIDRLLVEAPAAVFASQEECRRAFDEGRLHRDVVCVIRFQGPRANGMPELHDLNPPLGALQDLGYRVAIITDGRMSGASGKVPSVIHLSPEGASGGPVSRIADGDPIRLDLAGGRLDVLVDDAEWRGRPAQAPDRPPGLLGMGRDLFAVFRAGVSGADQGASLF